MEKLFISILLLLTGCTFQSSEERFVNPLFYKKLSCIPRDYDVYLSPYGITSTAHEPFNDMPCTLLENAEKSVTLSCTLKEESSQKFVFKYVLTDYFHYKGCRVVDEYSRDPDENRWTGHTGFCLGTNET